MIKRVKEDQRNNGEVELKRNMALSGCSGLQCCK